MAYRGSRGSQRGRGEADRGVPFGLTPGAPECCRDAVRFGNEVDGRCPQHAAEQRGLERAAARQAPHPDARKSR